MAFSELVLDCGNVDCAHCTAIRETPSRVELEAQKQARLTHVKNARAMTNSGSIGEHDDTPPVLSSGADSFSIAHRPAEKTLEEFCGLESFEQRESIDEIMWSAADKEQPELITKISECCDFEEDEEYEMVDLHEAQSDEARVLEMFKGKGRAVVVRRWFTRSSSD